MLGLSCMLGLRCMKIIDYWLFETENVNLMYNILNLIDGINFMILISAMVQLKSS
jgi:hypothetical protein